MDKTITIIDDDKQTNVCEKLDSANMCFWDKHPIASKKIISCPLRFKPSQIIKIYKHPISNERYTIKENINYQNISHTEYVKKYLVMESQIEVVDTFCSFNCCLAYILDNKHDPSFINSENILRYMWNEICPDTELSPSPSWRLIKGFGGSLSINKFRKLHTSDRVYVIHGSILDRLYLSSN
jgi:hypothetical protein